MNSNILLPPDAIARQEMLKKRQTESSKDLDSSQLIDQKQAKDHLAQVADNSTE